MALLKGSETIQYSVRDDI